MRKLYCASLFFLATFASADTNWSGALYYNLKTRDSSVVALTKLTDFSRVLGKFSLELDGFAGVALNGQLGVAGFTVGRSFPIADQVSAFAGAAVAVSSGRPVSVGFVAGVSVRF
jgi:hypothetical protein